MDLSKRKLSVEPLALVNCYIPSHLRTKSSYTILAGLVPPNSQNLAIFMQPLLEELSVEFSVFDVLTGDVHNARAIMLFGCFDYAAIPNVTHTPLCL
jgi:hypothetical protein